MIKEQVLILKVRYDDSKDDPPHTWGWSTLIDNGLAAEVLNHGAEEAVEDRDMPGEIGAKKS
jgi:hypothetical protein